MAKGLFITATGTDVGKTYVTALIIKKLREAGYAAGYYKAALSGAEQTEHGLLPGDAHYVAQIANIPEQPTDLVSYIYETAVSPHLAAKLENNPIEMKKIVRDFFHWKEKYEFLTVEGSGGVVCPLRYDTQQIMLTDVIQQVNLPVLIVADAKLGSINATVLTVAYLQQKQIPIQGIILNHFQADDCMENDNREMIEALTGIPVLATVIDGEQELSVTAKKLTQIYAEI